MPEVWQIIHSGVVEEGKVDDVSVFFFPLPRKIEGDDERERGTK